MYNLGIATNSNNKNSNISFGAKKIPKDVSKYLKKSLLKAKNVDIFVHVSPETDPDAANSAMTLANKLIENGVNARIKTGTKPLKDLIVNHNVNKPMIDEAEADVSILLDVNEIKRVSDNPKGKIFVFDHHIDTGKIPNAYKYIDESARSCCAMVFRLLKSWKIKLTKADAQNLLYGTCDDFIKSKYLKVSDSKIEELPAFMKDKNSQKVLKKLRQYLSKTEQKEVFTKLDVLSNLTEQEKAFQKRMFSEVKVTPNKKLAYIAIDPYDNEWHELGMDNTRTSTILRDLRMRLINGIKHDDAFTGEQKELFKDVKGAIIFYRTLNKPYSVYQMSIHSKHDYAEKLIKYIKKNVNPSLEAGGHPNRAGGRIMSINKNDIEAFMDSFFAATEKVD